MLTVSLSPTLLGAGLLIRHAATLEDPRASYPASPSTASSTPDPVPLSLEELVQEQAAMLEEKLTDNVKSIVKTILDSGKEALVIEPDAGINEKFEDLAEALCIELSSTIKSEVNTTKATLLDSVKSDALFELMAQKLMDMTATLHDVMQELDDERRLTAVLSRPRAPSSMARAGARESQRGSQPAQGMPPPSLPRAGQELTHQSSLRNDASSSDRYTPASVLDPRYDRYTPSYDRYTPESSFSRSSDRDRYMLPSLRYPGYIGYGPSGSRYHITDRYAPGTSSLYPSSGRYASGSSLYGPAPPRLPYSRDYDIEGTFQGLDAERSRRYDAHEGGYVWEGLGSRAGIRRSFRRMSRGE